MWLVLYIDSSTYSFQCCIKSVCVCVCVWVVSVHVFTYVRTYVSVCPCVEIVVSACVDVKAT